MKKAKYLIASMIAAMLFGCGGGGGGGNPGGGENDDSPILNLSAGETSLYVGYEYSLTATLDDGTHPEVTWESSESSVVTVDSVGLVKAVKAGNAVITATTTDGKYSANCECTVSDASSSPFKYTTSGSTIIITEYTGTDSEVIIPRTIGGLSVTVIKDNAFDKCTGLTSLSIPASVTSLTEYGLGGCSKLTKVLVDKDNSEYCDVDGIVYNKSKTKICIFPSGRTGSFDIPTSVTTIGIGAFSGCSGLTNVTIPTSVTTIGDSAFSGCSGLTNMTIPTSVTTISQWAFSGCSGLKSMVIQARITDLASNIFSNCTGLTSVTLPPTLISIGSLAFDGCSGLPSITIPSSVESIWVAAFNKCTSLTSVYIPSSVTSIQSGAFRDCTSLKTVTLQSTSVPTISENVFYYDQGNYNYKIIPGLAIKVPSASLSAYKSATNWKVYGDAGIISGY